MSGTVSGTVSGTRRTRQVFVANPNKTPPVMEILTKNQDKLLRFLSDFQSSREDEEFTKEKEARPPNPQTQTQNLGSPNNEEGLTKEKGAPSPYPPSPNLYPNIPTRNPLPRRGVH